MSEYTLIRRATSLQKWYNKKNKGCFPKGEQPSPVGAASVVDKKTPDLSDWLGAAICIVGVSIMLWAPRS